MKILQCLCYLVSSNSAKFCKFCIEIMFFLQNSVLSIDFCGQKTQILQFRVICKFCVILSILQIHMQCI